MEGDAGTRQLNPTPADETPDQSVEVPTESTEERAEEFPEQVDNAEGPGRRPSRLGRGWVAGICAGLVLAAIGAGVGGWLALRSHQDSEEIARNEATAIQAAKECVTATQAPDIEAITASQTKIIECSTGDFGAQATLYSSMLVDAYKAANVKVQVSDMRAAVEKHNDDGTMDLLVALRVKVSNTEATDQEQGYRLRVQMAPVDGTYKVARLDQVAS
ncbi:hypothetical protein [Mycobacterium hubeiense]|uniref:hypothetical protein n=1 Tax=Mycobacterium hubeiense TaxID=1867256 RepID=UPI000C7F1200|nr:hypothetical protein [Mycobacterium sp. QGD 101]